VTVSPILKMPPAPVAPDRLMLPAVTTGCLSSTVAALPDVVVALPAWSVVVTATCAALVSMAPAVIVYVAVHTPAPSVATTAEPPPNCERF
jgi:hypothetical protein